jgi:uncharacterized protein (TIGR02453 family)
MGKVSSMADMKAIFKKDTFQFFRELGRNNCLEWMAENRERYRCCVVQPFRLLLEELTPSMSRLDGRFDLCGKSGKNFSRINRDIRFAKDKTLYKTHMYIKFAVPAPGNRETGQLYAGLSKETVTAGFRIYMDAPRRDSTIALVAQTRMMANPKWAKQQQKKLGGKYDSYWYAKQKGKWTQQEGWPTEAEHWRRLQAWVVRRKMKPSAALQASFPGELLKIYKELYPILEFTSIP